MFWVQLRQLMWKNILIRTRSKVSHLLLIKFWKCLQILQCYFMCFTVSSYNRTCMATYFVCYFGPSSVCTYLHALSFHLVYCLHKYMGFLFLCSNRTKGLKDYKNECELLLPLFSCLLIAWFK